MRIIFLLILLILGGSIQAQPPAECAPPGGQPLRIGVVFPPDSLFGSDAADPYRGVQALVAAANTCGGLNDLPVELVSMPAANYAEAVAAAETLSGHVPVIVGSGSGAVSEVLANAAGEGTFFYWEVTEPLDNPHAYTLSPRPNNAQLGAQAAMFVESEAIDLLDEDKPLRVALVYEDNPVAQMVAAGVRVALAEPPLIDQLISEDRSKMAVQMRERGVNVVIVAAFERHADRLWYQLREADANLAAWVQVGEDIYRHNMCSRIGNTDGIISIGAAGAVNNEYRLATFPAFYKRYASAYAEQFQRAPSERADVAASGMLILLSEILPSVEGDITPEVVAAAATSLTGTSAGLMSESWHLDTETLFNEAAVAVVSQQQSGASCTIAPGAIATCSQPLQVLPTWRERARTSSC